MKKSLRREEVGCDGRGTSNIRLRDASPGRVERSTLNVEVKEGEKMEI